MPRFNMLNIHASTTRFNSWRWKKTGGCSRFVSKQWSCSEWSCSFSPRTHICSNSVAANKFTSFCLIWDSHTCIYDMPFFVVFIISEPKTDAFFPFYIRIQNEPHHITINISMGKDDSFIKRKMEQKYSQRKQKRVTMTDQTTQHFVYFNVLMLSNGLRRFLFPLAEHILNTIAFARRNSAIDFIILAWFRNVSIWKGHTACSEWKYRLKNIWIEFLRKWVCFFDNLSHDTKWPFKR